jgi:hypothetical protein
VEFVAGFPKFYEATKVSSTQQFQTQAELQDKSTDIVAGVSMFYEATKVSSTQYFQPQSEFQDKSTDILSGVSMFYEQQSLILHSIIKFCGT